MRRSDSVAALAGVKTTRLPLADCSDPNADAFLDAIHDVLEFVDRKLSGSTAVSITCETFRLGAQPLNLELI